MTVKKKLAVDKAIEFAKTYTHQDLKVEEFKQLIDHLYKFYGEQSDNPGPSGKKSGSAQS